MPKNPRLRTWRLDAKSLPSWVRSRLIEKRQPGNPVIIRTDEGDHRLEEDDVVIEQAGVVAVYPAEQAAELVRRERDSNRPPSASNGGSASARIAKPKRFAPAKGRPPSVEMRHPDELSIDDSYQRSIDTGPSRRLISSIATNWDWRLCMPLTVSRRESGLYVIDGQHRLEAAKLRGDIPYLPCCVSTYDGPADEAAMFVAANRARRAISRLDDFHAAIVAGDATASNVDSIVRAAGLTVSRKTGSQSWLPGEVAFTAAIKRTLNAHGKEICVEALSAIAKAFPGEILSNGGSIFLALTRIILKGDAELDRLFRTLLAHDMKGWGGFVEKARRGDDRVSIMTAAIRAAYDNGSGQ